MGVGGGGESCVVALVYNPSAVVGRDRKIAGACDHELGSRFSKNSPVVGNKVGSDRAGYLMSSSGLHTHAQHMCPHI